MQDKVLPGKIRARPHSGDTQRFYRSSIVSKKLSIMFGEKSWQPPTDVFETEDKVVVKVDISGVEPQKLLVEFDGTRLRISGQREDRHRMAKRAFRQMEVNYGTFESIVEIDVPVNSDRTQATYRSGFLEVVLPKGKQAKTSQKPIQIKLSE